MQLFYTPDIKGSFYTLSEEESKHITRVLRMQTGDSLHLSDGKGTLYNARISNDNQKRCEIEILSSEKNYGKLPYSLHVAVAPTKNLDRLEWFVEKATEIGIDSIIPLICQHSERRELKTERLEKVAISAMKQSIKAYLPQIATPQKFSDFIKNATGKSLYIAHCQEGEKARLTDCIKSKTEIYILIGPEGDFSNEEIAIAALHKATAITLGTSRLRTETAALVACAQVAALLGE